MRNANAGGLGDETEIESGLSGMRAWGRSQFLNFRAGRARETFNDGRNQMLRVVEPMLQDLLWRWRIYGERLMQGER